MLKSQNNTGRSVTRVLFFGEIGFLIFTCAYVIIDWLNHIGLNQDSVSYIEVAVNLLKSGKFYMMLDHTNFINPPGLIPYLNEPAGFQLLLVPFLLILHDPLIAAIVAQSVFLVFFYVILYLMTIRLGFSSLLRIVTIVLFTFVAPLRLVHNFYWTETLFIALTLAAGYLAIGLLSNPRRKRDWVLFILAVAVSTTLRYIGVVNLVWITPFILKRDFFRQGWRLVTHRFTFLGLAVLGGGLIALSLLVDLLPNAKPGIGHVQARGLALGTATLAIGLIGFGIVHRKEINLRSTGAPASDPGKPGEEASTWAFIAVLATFLPTAIWFARNQLFFHSVYSFFTIQNGINQAIQFVPFRYVWDNALSFHLIPTVLALAIFTAVLLLPLSPLPGLRMSRLSKMTHILLASMAAIYFLFTWLVSMAVAIEPFGDRYFSPIQALLLLALLNGLWQLCESLRSPVWKNVAAVTPLFFLILSTGFSWKSLTISVGKVNFPAERQLWTEIDKIGWTHISQFFYSDEGYSAGGYIHQLFSNRPQGILWNPSVVKNPGKLKTLLAVDGHPFLLVTATGRDAKFFNEMMTNGTLPLQKIVFGDVGYSLYYLPNQ